MYFKKGVIDMKRTKKEQLALLEETINFYSEDTTRRAINLVGACQYSYDDKSCAVGRCFKYPEIVQAEYGNTRYSTTMEKFFKDQYKGYSFDFWRALQYLHDNNPFWNDNKGLSPNGLSYVEELKLKIQEGKI